MAAVKTMEDLFLLHTLKDIYYAEKLIYRSLPKDDGAGVVAGAETGVRKTSPGNRRTFERLEQIFEDCEVAARGVRCEAMDSIIAEAKDIMEEVEDDQVRGTPGMLAAAQSCRALRNLALRHDDRLGQSSYGMKNAVKLLQQTLDEEKKTDKLLSDLALKKQVNQEAE